MPKIKTSRAAAKRSKKHVQESLKEIKLTNHIS